jgi:hypothetical protein
VTDQAQYDGLWRRVAESGKELCGKPQIVPYLARLAAHCCAKSCVFDSMKRALHACVLLHKLDSSAKEKPMPERVNSFAPRIPGVFAVLVATIAVHFSSPARADSACLEQPSQPAAEGTRWSLHYDRAKGRKCWILVDASTNGHEAAAAQAQPNAASTLSEQIASLLGNLTGAAANLAPQPTVPQVSPATAPRKPQGNTANASKADNGIHADQRSIGEGHTAKRVSPVLTQPEREALFEEFLRWQQDQQSPSTLLPVPSSR